MDKPITLTPSFAGKHPHYVVHFVLFLFFQNIQREWHCTLYSLIVLMSRYESTHSLTH